jgi:hypothetical protein
LIELEPSIHWNTGQLGAKKSSHRITVKAWDAVGSFAQTVKITVP